MSLANTNPYHKGKDKEAVRLAFVRSVASSTAVTTGQSIDELIEVLIAP